LTRADS